MPDPILCHECGHDIDMHYFGADDGIQFTTQTPDGDRDYECLMAPSDIARAYGEERFNEGWDACELRWAVGHSE